MTRKNLRKFAYLFRSKNGESCGSADSLAPLARLRGPCRKLGRFAFYKVGPDLYKRGPTDNTYRLDLYVYRAENLFVF